MAFLSVITRNLYSRPNLLIMNKASLVDQSDQDYEQIVEVDQIGSGWQYALEMLKVGTARSTGNYILVLDDDDMMINKDAVKLWKEATINQPPAVIHKCRFADLGILPEKEYWEKRPEMGHIGSFSFILRRDIMMIYLTKIGVGHYASDFDLISAIWMEHKAQIVWLDRVMCGSMKRSIGRGEQ